MSTYLTKLRSHFEKRPFWDPFVITPDFGPFNSNEAAVKVWEMVLADFIAHYFVIGLKLDPEKGVLKLLTDNKVREMGLTITYELANGVKEDVTEAFLLWLIAYEEDLAKAQVRRKREVALTAELVADRDRLTAFHFDQVANRC